MTDRWVGEGLTKDWRSDCYIDWLIDGIISFVESIQVSNFY